MDLDLASVITGLRRKHKELIGFELDVRGQRAVFIFRPLTAVEFEQYLQVLDYGDVADDIISSTLLYPNEDMSEISIQEVTPGIYESVALQIVSSSGFSDPKQAKGLMNIGRNRSRTFPGVMEMFICKAFPRYTPDDISKMTVPEQFKLAAMAEQMLGIEFPMKEFFGKPERVTSDIPSNFEGLEIRSDEEIERLTQGAITKEALSRLASRVADPEAAVARRVALKDKIARQRSNEGA
jgi:hypothetical protein